MSSQNKVLATSIMEELYSKGDMSVVDKIVSADYVYRAPGLEVRGPKDLKEFVAEYRTAFPDLNVRIDDMIAEGEKVAIRFTMSGTHAGDFDGLAPTNKKVEATGILINRYENGKLVEDWDQFDIYSLMQQLGAVE
jgi:steroid delta-isomerase-like uncharacterized protein